MSGIVSFSTLQPQSGDNKWTLLAKILLATLAGGGGGGGSITLADITDLPLFWQSMLSSTPVGNRIFGTDNDANPTTYEVSTTGTNLLKLTGTDGVIVKFESDGTLTTLNPASLATFLVNGAPVVDGTFAPPSSITMVNGLVSVAS